MEDKITVLKEFAQECGKIVFFGGAGVSTESGIPDFRSQDGLYHMQYAVPPETILSSGYFYSHTEDFYRFYREKMLCFSAKPNAAHKKLAEWERSGKLLAVVTQNIDGLHQLAGSKNVYELHGSVHRNRCLQCGKAYSAETIGRTQGVPRCACGGLIKPDVVLYGEPLDEKIVQGAVNAIGNVAHRLSCRGIFALFPRKTARPHQSERNAARRLVRPCSACERGRSAFANRLVSQHKRNKE